MTAKEQRHIIEKYHSPISNILGTDKWEFVHTEYENIYYGKFPTGCYVIKMEKEVLASFQLVQMIGCCGILVSTQSSVHRKLRGKGLGTVLNSLRVEMARNMGYGILLCTDVESNAAQRKILAKNGWQDIYDFKNPRTGNRVFISVINL